MKKIKYLSIISITMILVTSCGFAGVIPEIDKQLANATVLTTQFQQDSAINNISRLKLQPTLNNTHVADFSSSFKIGILEAQSSGFIDFIFDRNNQKTYVDIKLEGLVNINAKIENDLLTADVDALGFDLISNQGQSISVPKKPLNEIIDLSFITVLDRSIIKRYRTADLSYDLFKTAREIWALDIDANLLNESIDPQDLVFLTDPEIIIVGDSRNNTLVLVMIRGKARVNNSLNIDFAFYSYILP